jgi:transposase
MLALATTHEGDVPVFLRPLSGNSSDQVSLVAAVEALQEHLRAPEAGEDVVYVADGALYRTANITRLNALGIPWISRVPGTSAEAKAMLGRSDVAWHQSANGATSWWSQTRSLPQGEERWVIVRTAAGEAQARARVQRTVEKARAAWTQRLWHLSHQDFACEADALAALERERRELPAWLEVQGQVVAQPRYTTRGRPRKGATPVASVWRLQAQVSANQERVEQEVQRQACFIVGTNRLEPTQISAEELAATYKDQGSVERGFRFLKDPCSWPARCL